jgi:large subunit ribosomal protein L15
MKLSDLRPAKGATHPRKRLGKGRATGQGGTSGKGHKGLQARAGGNAPGWFEGGQMPLQRRVPKRGFRNVHAADVQVVNVGLLERHFESGAVIDLAALHAKRLVRSPQTPVKLLAKGESARAFTIRVHAASRAAREKIEAAGGSLEIVG